MVDLPFQPPTSNLQPFQVIPAIDILGGRCVRLYQGDYARETVFSEDPLAVASRWEALGAERLHVVDLDGARTGRCQNGQLVAEIARKAKVPVQVGGGLRTPQDVESLLSAGADRVVIGTSALADREFLLIMLRRYGPSRVVVAADAVDGAVAIRGWQERTSVRAVDLVLSLAEIGLQRVLYTDISRDGTLQGPNVDGVRQLVEGSGLAVIASGGISRPEHLVTLREAGAEAAVVGKALYAGQLSLEAAQKALEG